MPWLTTSLHKPRWLKASFPPRFPGSQLPWLFIGMEYVRTNSLQLAQQCLVFWLRGSGGTEHAEDCARTLMPTDPHVYNELGVVAYHKRNYEEVGHARHLCGHSLGCRAAAQSH